MGNSKRRGFVWIRLPTLVLFIFLAAPSLQGIAAEAESPAVAAGLCSLPETLARTRPNPRGEPVQVAMGVFIIDVINVDDQKESFEVDYRFSLRWRDPRLAAAARGGSLAGCRVKLKEIWQPAVRVVNLRAPVTVSQQDVDVAADGTVSFYERRIDKLSSPLNLNDFPFDEQKLTIEFASSEYGPKDVVFLADVATTGRLEGIFLPGWHILSNVSDADVAPIITASGQRTRLDHTIKIARQPGYYIWKYVLPLCFIVLMSWSVFWLDPEHVGPQIGVATATAFALIAFLISLSQGLPQVAYLTRLDQLAVSATVLVFLALGEAIVTSRLTQRGHSELGRRLDRYGRWLFLGIFVAVLFITLLL